MILYNSSFRRNKTSLTTLVIFCILSVVVVLLSCGGGIANAQPPSSDKDDKTSSSTSDMKRVPLLFPERFIVNFKVTNRDDGEHRFDGTVTISKKTNGHSHIRLSSTTIVKEMISLMGSPEKRRHVEKTKKYYFDSTKFAFREVVHTEDASPSSRLLSTLPFEFHKLIDIIENENYLIPENEPIFDTAVNKMCPSTNNLRLLIFFEHQHYVICVDKKASFKIPLVSYIINSNFIVKIDRFIPVTDEHQLLINPEEDKYFPVTSLKKSNDNEQQEQESIQSTSSSSNKVNTKKLMKEKAYLFDAKYSCSLSWIRDESMCGSLVKEPIRPNRTCIFLHGVGQWPSQAGPPVNDFPDYWGKVSSYTPQCTERWFIREETKYRGWNSSELQHSYCALSLFNNTGNVIRDKILFTHSMGTLILAAAIQNGICAIDKDTVSWYDVMGPIRGSKASLFLKEICVRANTWTDPSIYKIVADEGGYCIGGNSTNVYPAYGTLAPNFPGIQELVNYTAPYVTGQMCGASAYGLNSIYAVPLFLLSELVGYGLPNDGMVPVPSCQISPENPLGFVFSDLYYEVSANHADGTCRDGDAWWGNSKPCSYYTNKV